MEENELAWRLYNDARAPGAIGSLLYGLESASLTPDEAFVLAGKIRALTYTIAELEEEKRKAEADRAKNANR